MRRRGEVEIPNQKYTGKGPKVTFRAAVFPRTFKAQGGRDTSGPFDAPLSWYPHQAHPLFKLCSIIHQEALGAQMSVGQVLSMQVDQRLDCLCEQKMTAVLFEGKVPQTRKGWCRLVCQDQGASLDTIAQDGMQDLVVNTQLTPECCNAFVAFSQSPSFHICHGACLCRHWQQLLFIPLCESPFPPLTMLIASHSFIVQIHFHPHTRRGWLLHLGQLFHLQLENRRSLGVDCAGTGFIT
mmetsp:Transcript_41141/g.65158  ORF Transcript_41141/g.65158 Transcript_41141/m.65158 type:complete len:239 (-) Transcript_41141:892-1608(-)